MLTAVKPLVIVWLCLVWNGSNTIAQELTDNDVGSNQIIALESDVSNTMRSDPFGYPGPESSCGGSGRLSEMMDTQNFTLLQYRRLFRQGTTPAPHELVGVWRGVNKGIVELAGYRQFIKEITPTGNVIIGDNIQVHQVSSQMLESMGWQPKFEPNGELERRGKFMVQPPQGIGAFRKGIVFSYRDGGNPPGDAARLLVDKVVKLDDDHLLGRATANFGPLQIPLAYFVLERVH